VNERSIGPSPLASLEIKEQYNQTTEMDISRQKCIVMMYIRDIREGDSGNDGLIATLILMRKVVLSMNSRKRGEETSLYLLMRDNDEGCG